MKKVINIAISALILVLITACCCGGSYYATIERDGNLTVFDKDKVKECVLNYRKNSGNDFYDPLEFNNIKPSVGLYIKYKGELRGGVLINIYVYPEHNKTKKIWSHIELPCDTKNRDIYLITDELLQELNITDDTNHVTDGIFIESVEKDKKYPPEKYIIKITKDELNRALDLKHSQYDQELNSTK